jgi:DNA polymerase I-like protein with 3'-5' exonuclease and polymerase domains
MGDLPSWSGAKRVAIDCETKDIYLKDTGIGVRRGGYIAGVSFAIEDGPCHYLPLRHNGGDNVDCAQGLAYLRAQGAAFTGEIVGANLSYDLDYLWEEDINFPLIKYFRDIQIADPLIYELHMSYSLDNIAKRHGLPGKDETLLEQAAKAYGVGAKNGMWQLPGRYVGPYATADVVQPLLTLRRQERLIEEKDLWDIYNLESEVLPVLVRMRRRGVRIDQDKLTEIEDWSLREEAAALNVVHRETGVKIAVGEVWKSDALVPALEHIGLDLPKTSTGKKSVSQDVFASYDHPVTKAIAWSRKVNKLRTTFAESIRHHITNGRIHCTFNQIARESETGDQKGARYGRLSATNPNLQQQPNPDKDPAFAGEWRKVYLPEEDCEWACCDYSQQEPRWTTHFAAMMDLPKAREAAQAYHDDPNLDNHQFMADLTGLKRTYAKNIYLGLCYGEGGAKLCDDLGLPTRWAIRIGRGRDSEVMYFETHEEALEQRKQHPKGFVWRAAGEEGQAILDTFDDRAPFIRKIAREAEERAKQRGYVITAGGRRLHFTQREDGSYDWTHKSFNRVIQGTSADQMKKAMIAIDRAGFHMMLQVHDETDHSIADRAEADAIAELMCDAMPALVPFKVDVEIGPSWGEIK